MNQPSRPRRRPAWRRPLRLVLFIILGLIVLAAGAGGVFLAQFDPNSLKPRIIEAVKRATGRDLVLNGKIGLKAALSPTIEITDAEFANPPGYSRPQMATLRRMELQLGLLPLLSNRVEIERLVLIQPDILLETNAAGAPNWQFTPEVSPVVPVQAAPRSGPARSAVAVSVAAIRIQDGTLAYRNDRSGRLVSLAVSRLDATAASPDAPVHLETDATYKNTVFNLVADTGGLARLQQRDATTPWPVKLALKAAGATLTADGTMTHPLSGQGYTLSVTGAVPDVAGLAPLLPMHLPPLHDVRFAGKVADQGAALPAISALTLHVGASDLSAEVPSLAVETLDVAGAGFEQPIKVSLAARFADAPLTVAATLGAPSQLMPGAQPKPFPVDITAQAAGATLSAKGNVADIQARTGVNVAVNAAIPDLAALSPLVHTPLPALKSVAFQANVTDMPGGVVLHGLTLKGPDGDLAGDAQLRFAPRPALAATLTSSRLDLDAIRQVASPAPAGSAPVPGEPNPPPRPRRSDRLFSEQPVRLQPLRDADADVKLSVGTLRDGGLDYRSIVTHLVLTAGKLNLDPITGDLPGGHMTGQLSVDASQAEPPVHLVVHAPGLALKPLLTALNQPAFANGNLEVNADLSGAGASPHALAASLDGTLGLALAGGTLDNRLLGSMLGRVMDELNALNLVGRGGTSELRCFGARLDIRRGTASVRTLALASSLLTATGDGSVNLGAETLALTLRPQAKLVGTPVIIPIEVSGPIRDPAARVNKIGTATSNVGSVAGAVIGDATPLGALGGLLGANRLLVAQGDVCPAALAAARGQPAPAAAPAPAPAKPSLPNLSNPGAVLRNLLR